MRAPRDERCLHTGRGRGKAGWLLAGVALVVLAVAVAAYLRSRRPHEPPPRPQATPIQPQAAASPRHPVAPPPADPARPPPPSLSESDPVVQATATDLLGRAAQELLQTDDMVRRWVITIDALPRARLPQRASPVHRAEGQLVADGSPDATRLSPENYARYERYLAVAESLDPQAVVSAYRWLYPLFQQTYSELVRPEGYFNDRLIEVIDHLLQTPDLPAEPALTRPHTTYRLADPELESLSAGRKALLRMGPDNARRAKAVLERLRAELLRDAATAAPADG